MHVTRSYAKAAMSGRRPAGDQSRYHVYPAHVTVAAFSALTLLFVAMRVYTRITFKGNWGLDDCIPYSPALHVNGSDEIEKVSSFAFGGLVLAFVEILRQPALWKAPSSGLLHRSIELRLAVNSIFALCSTFAKLALLLLYLRLFDVRRALRYVLRASMAAVVGVNAAFVALIVSLYAPQRARGDSAFSRAVRPATPIYIAHATFNAASDVWLLAIPVYAVAGLHMSGRRKIATAAAFTTGLAACVCAVMRSVYRVKLSHGAEDPCLVLPYLCASVAELNICIVCACMPVVWRLLRDGAYRVRRLVSVSSTSASQRLSGQLSSPTRTGSKQLPLPPPQYSESSAMDGSVGRPDDAAPPILPPVAVAAVDPRVVFYLDETSKKIEP